METIVNPEKLHGFDVATACGNLIYLKSSTSDIFSCQDPCFSCLHSHLYSSCMGHEKELGRKEVLIAFFS